MSAAASEQEPPTLRLPRIAVVASGTGERPPPALAAEPLQPAPGDLGTLRLLLRPVDPDAALTVLAGRAPSGMEMAPGYPSPHSLDLLAHTARGASPEDVGPFFVVRRADHALVGEIGCRLDAGAAHVGYTIAEPCWNLGYATEALRALLAHLFGEVRVPTVRAETLATNGASRRVLEKAGMRPRGLRHGDDSPATVVCYEAVAGNWALPLPFSTRTRTSSSRRARARRPRPFVG